MNIEVNKNKVSFSTRASALQTAARPQTATRTQAPAAPTQATPVVQTNFEQRNSAITANSEVNRVLTEAMNVGNQSTGNQASSADAYRSNTPVALEGYNSDKLNNPNHRTPKYIFGRVAQQFKLDSVTPSGAAGKAEAEKLLSAMVPELQKAGLEVVSVKGDRIQVKTEVGYEWVDVVRGSEGSNPGWQWGSEGKGTAQPTSDPKEWAQLTGQTAGGAAAAPSAGGAPAPVANSHGGLIPLAFGGAGGALPTAVRSTVLGDAIDSVKVLAVLKKYPPTNEGIRSAMPELTRLFPGVQLLDHPERLDKLQFPNGAVVDVVMGAGGREPKWGWIPEN